jgi:hypothetical protein
MRTPPAVLLPGLWLLIMAGPAAAQTAVTSARPMPRVFIGAGGGPSTNDAASRMRIHDDDAAGMWLVEAGAAVSKRVSLGVEYSQPSAATAATTVGSGRTQLSGRQTERLLLGMVRARVGGGPRIALDLVAGSGLLFQRHQSGSCIFAQPQCENTSGDSLEKRTRAHTTGLDVPVRVAPHVEFVGSARVYFLRRGVRTANTVFMPSWQFEWEPSARIAGIITGRVIW